MLAAPISNRRISRRSFLALGSAALLAGPAIARASSSKFIYKYATGQAPTHPINIRLLEAFDRIYKRTGGRLQIKLFPANQLGTETAVLSQIRSGSLELLALSASILATLVPVSGIVNTGYAFIDYDTVWKALDGSLGKYIQAQIAKVGLVSNGKIWDNGFRQVTSSTRDIQTPKDFKGFKIRTPPAPMLTSLFSALGASPTAMNFSEVYSALQTHVIDGQENALSLIWTTKLYEVQKHCAMTGHSWDGYWPLANKRAWEQLPEDVKAIVVAELNQSALDERSDVAKLDHSVRHQLEQTGMVFRDIDKAQFRKTLGKTDYYKNWKKQYGDEAWGQLEAVCGKLA